MPPLAHRDLVNRAAAVPVDALLVAASESYRTCRL